MVDKIKISQLEIEENISKESLIPIVQNNKTKAIKSKDLLKGLDEKIDSIDSQLDTKANKSNVYTKTEVDTKISDIQISGGSGLTGDQLTLVNSISGIKDSVRPDKFYSCFKATATTAEGGDTNTTITNIDKRFFEFNVALTDPVQSYIYASIKLCDNADINDYVGHKKVNLFFQTTATGIITVGISKKGNWASAVKLLNQVEVDGDATKTHVVNLDLTCQEITDYFADNVTELNIFLIYKGYSSANAFSADSVTKGFIVYDDIDTELTSNTSVVNIAKQALVAEELSTKGKEDINNTINDVINNKPIGLDYITPNRFKVVNNVSTTMSSSGKVVTVKKVAGTTGKEINKYPKVYITIPCNNITDLDVDISLNLEKIAGNTEFNTFKICKSESDWTPSNLPIDINAFATFNPYRIIQSSKYASDYANLTSITIVISYYASNSSTTDYADKTFEYRFSEPTITTNQVVVATELSSNLANKLGINEYITGWGDSLTAGGGWTTLLSELSGLPFYNGATGGESVNTIMARQGADAIMINNVTIPADTTAVQLTDYATGFTTFFGRKATPLKQGGTSHVNPCYIGDVKGTLAFTGSSYNDETGVWTFTRLEAGEEVVINRPTPIRTNFDMNYNAPAIMIIFMGQNGGHDSTEDLIERHRLMIEHSKCKDFLILGLSSGTSTSLADYEAKMKAEFGRRFLSLRQYLSVYGLEDAGIEPTEQDIADMTEGKTPTSLRSDSVHYNSYGKEVIGKLVYKTVRDLNML